jgi:hypothetical protein
MTRANLLGAPHFPTKEESVHKKIVSRQPAEYEDWWLKCGCGREKTSQVSEAEVKVLPGSALVPFTIPLNQGRLSNGERQDLFPP